MPLQGYRYGVECTREHRYAAVVQSPPPKTEETIRDQQLRELRALIDNQERQLEHSDAPDHDPLKRIAGRIGPRRLIDCLAGTAGSGCGLIALRMCVEAARIRGELVVIDRQGIFYPPTAIAWGCDARKLLVVSARSDTDALAATEIALRSTAVSAVWADLGAIDGRQFRRLLLAAESGEAFGALVRSARYQADPSLGDVQLRFDPVAEVSAPESPLLVRVTQTRNRHGPASGKALLSIDWRTGQVVPLPRASHDQGNRQDDCDLAARLASAVRSA